MHQHVAVGQLWQEALDGVMDDLQIFPSYVMLFVLCVP
jgi:hypothetical protein